MDMSRIQTRNSVNDKQHQNRNVSSDHFHDDAILSPSRKEGTEKLAMTQAHIEQPRGSQINHGHSIHASAGLENMGVNNVDINSKGYLPKSKTPMTGLNALSESTQALPIDRQHLYTDEQPAARRREHQDEHTYLQALMTDNRKVNSSDIDDQEDENALVQNSTPNVTLENTASNNFTPSTPGPHRKNQPNKENFPLYTLPPSPPPPPQVAPTPRSRLPLQEIRVDDSGIIHRGQMFPRTQREPTVRHSGRVNQSIRRETHTLLGSTTPTTDPVQFSLALDIASGSAPSKRTSGKSTASFNTTARKFLLENTAGYVGKRSYDDFVEWAAEDNAGGEGYNDTLIPKKRKIVKDHNRAATSSLMDVDHNNHELIALSTVPRSSKAQKRKIFSPHIARCKSTFKVS
jgi:hypothetical protein